MIQLCCNNCGVHHFTRSALNSLEGLTSDPEQRAVFAYRLRKVSVVEVINSDTLKALNGPGKLPHALERIDNLLMYMVNHQPEPGAAVTLNPNNLQASLGCIDADAVRWVLDSARTLGLMQGTPRGAETLTLKGWQQHRDLLQRGVNSRHAFMAMDFKQADIKQLFNQYLVPGVERTGFKLRTTDHVEKTAGHIDARMRVELRTSRFVVCDLTDNNRGAYWEAGFAEGIGLPVFYLCQKDVHTSQDPEVKPHFDIAHQAIVKWDLADPAAAVEELVAMIRATLPGEARMED